MNEEEEIKELHCAYGIDVYIWKCKICGKLLRDLNKIQLEHEIMMHKKKHEVKEVETED